MDLILAGGRIAEGSVRGFSPGDPKRLPLVRFMHRCSNLGDKKRHQCNGDNGNAHRNTTCNESHTHNLKKGRDFEQPPAVVFGRACHLAQGLLAL